MRTETPSASPLCSAEMLKKLLGDVRGKNVTVLGLGFFGGGEGAARFLCERGANVTVMDLKSEEELAPALSRLSDLPLRFRLRGHNEDDIRSSDLIVLNPAVPRNSDIVAFASRQRIPMSSPMNMFLSLCAAPVVAVTGSVGKSTTTAMLAEILVRSGCKVHMGGNIGISMLAFLDRMSSGDTAVVELSSVQLEDAAALPFSPHVAVVTNIVPNHLDRYRDFESYVAAKKNIIKYQDTDALAVLNREDPLLRGRWAGQVRGNLLYFDGGGTGEYPFDTAAFEGARLEDGNVVWYSDGKSESLFAASDLPLLGAHNLKNAIAASVAARWLGARPEDIKGALRGFKPLEHRLERCRRVGGVTFYNDSDSTTPDSTIAAINAFPPPITLICGGKDKKCSYEKLTEVIVNKVDVLVTLGQSGPAIAQSTREKGAGSGGSPIILETSSLSEAVARSYEHSMPGSTVLLSPSCSSLDMFSNYVERGREFKKMVKNLASRPDTRRATA